MVVWKFWYFIFSVNSMLLLLLFCISTYKTMYEKLWNNFPNEYVPFEMSNFWFKFMYKRNKICAESKKQNYHKYFYMISILTHFLQFVCFTYTCFIYVWFFWIFYRLFSFINWPDNLHVEKRIICFHILDLKHCYGFYRSYIFQYLLEMVI